MRELIIIPTIFKRTDVLCSHQTLIRLIVDDLGFDIDYSDFLTPRATRADRLLIWAGAHGTRTLLESAELGSGTRIIYLIQGTHKWSKEHWEAVIQRADLVLYSYSARGWPAEERFVFFPQFFGPHDYFRSLRWNRDPLMKCLLTGHKNDKIYPIRSEIFRILSESKKWQGKIIRMRHPRWDDKETEYTHYEIPPVIGRDYAITLNGYFCSIATASIFNYGVAKYFEIPAAGTLLLGQRNIDIERAGLHPWIHYVPIKQSNVLEMIEAVLDYPEKFQGIRRKGRDFVRAKHSVSNRLKEFLKLLRRV